MKSRVAADGVTLLRMLESALDWLEAGAQSLDALNVFPVPDGDTGTNMLLTVRAALDGLRDTAAPGSVSTVSAVSAAMARGAMEGARGNSGIILSQVFGGLATALEGKQACTGADFTAGFLRASTLARAAISNPTEGTILTVLTDVAQALAQERPAHTASLLDTLETAVVAAAASVERTPSLLPVLREAGVVDAGAKGMLTILEGFLHALDNGRHPAPPAAQAAPARSGLPRESDSFGYCTEFLLAGEALPLAALRERLDSEGSSVILVGNDRTARIHLHTERPDAVIEYARSLGSVTRLEVQDLDRQCGAVSLAAGRQVSRTDMTIVSCVTGRGFAAVFRSMGAEVVEPAHPVAGASAAEVARVLAAEPGREVILLPNSTAARAAAESATAPEGMVVRIVPSLTLPQGIAALMAFRFDRDLEGNVQAMTRALAAVRTIEVPGAGAELGADPVAVLDSMLAREPPSSVGVVTIYSGESAATGIVERAAAACRVRFPGAAVETVRGGQVEPVFIVSLE